MPPLGVNIDHVATLRQARREFDPNPVTAAKICMKAGAHSIVAHLREDRRHINDKDIYALRRISGIRLNLEMSINRGIVKIVGDVKPHQATLVPEKRQEVTTEGGLDVIRYFQRVKAAVQFLQKKKISVSLFIAPSKMQIIKAKETGAGMIEIHTGHYALAKNPSAQKRELKKINAMTQFARSLGLTVSAGHGLKYHNTKAIARIPGMYELNIGHSIISRAVFVGLENAVKEMLVIVNERK